MVGRRRAGRGYVCVVRYGGWWMVDGGYEGIRVLTEGSSIVIGDHNLSV